MHSLPNASFNFSYQRIEENHGSEISVELSRGGRQLFSDRGVQAGLEVVNPALLLQGIVSLKAE